jgi:hypothetical protein
MTFKMMTKPCFPSFIYSKQLRRKNLIKKLRVIALRWWKRYRIKIEHLFQNFFLGRIPQSVGYKALWNIAFNIGSIRRAEKNNHITLRILSILRHRVSLSISIVIFLCLIQKPNIFRGCAEDRYIIQRGNEFSSPSI